jgi:predicted nuclease of predicted toxin-antitoxin system
LRLRFQADNDLNHAIVKGVRRREPAIDFQTARQARLHEVRDLDVLERAASENRILVTHDRKTMPGHFAEFLSGGNRSPGVVVISQKANLGMVIESLVLLWAASDPSEWENRIFDLPF